MDIKDMEYIVTVGKMKSFSKAAEKLFVSQPTLSQAVKRLEDKLGVEFFFRDKMKVEITEIGKMFIKDAEEILKNVSTLESKVKLMKQKDKKILSIGISWSYGKYFMIDILKIFKEKNWDYNFKIIEGESRFLEGQIEQGNIDFGIFPTPIYNENLITFPLVEEKAMLAIHIENLKAISIAREAKEKKKKILLSDLKDFPFILMKKGFKLRNVVNHICYMEGFDPLVLIESENLITCLSLVENNYGITILPDTVLNKSTSKEIEIFDIDNLNSVRHLALVANPNMIKYIKLDQLAEEFSKNHLKN